MAIVVLTCIEIPEYGSGSGRLHVATRPFFENVGRQRARPLGFCFTAVPECIDQNVIHLINWQNFYTVRDSANAQSSYTTHAALLQAFRNRHISARLS